MEPRTQDPAGEAVTRVNRETGELSASGELALPVQTADKLEGVEDNRAPRAPGPLLKALTQLLHELRTAAGPGPDHSQRERLLEALALYRQLGGAGVRAEGLDLSGLRALASEAVVLDINSRLTEKPAEEARHEVVEFFQKVAPEADTPARANPGWLLLGSLQSLLAAESSDVLSRIKPDFPAALVKCLYLLVCLPARNNSTPKEETFQDLLTQVLLQLCRAPACVETMVDTQELQCLMIGLTSLWDQTSGPWRLQASRVLRAVSAARPRNVVPALQARNSVRLCLHNLQVILAEVPGPVLAEVAVAVLGFVADSYPLSPALFLEFEANGGYVAVENILKRCESGVSADQFQPVEDLLSLVASLTLCGKAEIKVALCVSNPQPPGFKFDPPLTKGSEMKNLQAFMLLQGSMLRSEDAALGCAVLRTVRRIWEWSQANFFLLEWSLQSLAQFASCVWRKPAPVHALFFSLLEMVIFQLNYIPHETLRALLAVLNQSWTGALVSGGEFQLAALSCFHGLAVRSGLLADVLSEGGLLEHLLGELRRRAKILRKGGVAPAAPTGDLKPSSCVEESETVLTSCMLEVVASFTLRSVRNTVTVRDRGMLPYIKIFVDAEQYRAPTLSILEQLAEVNPEEFMSTAVGALCSSTQQELGLKRDLLQSVLRVIESPHSWDAFRRAGGFTGLLSLAVEMEGALCHPPQGPVWDSLNQQAALDILLSTLHILALAVCLHPVNAHHFHTGGFYEKLADALLQLGCFQRARPGPGARRRSGRRSPDAPEYKPSRGVSFHKFVELAEKPASAPSSSSPSSSSSSPPPPAAGGAGPVLPPTLRTCLRLLSSLDQFATGTYCAPEAAPEAEVKPRDGEVKGQAVAGPAGTDTLNGGPETDGTSQDHGAGRPRRPSSSLVCSESQLRLTCDHTIVNPGAIRVIISLLPSIFSPEDPELSMEVQYSVAQHIQAMVKSERNRQIMCEGGLVSTLLAHCGGILLDTLHPLSMPITRILEKLASQAITLPDLRAFLCLGDPLVCLKEKTARNSSKERHVPPQSTSNETDAPGAPPAPPAGQALQRSFSLLSSPSEGCTLPLHHMVSLVSMTSPRSSRPHRLSSSPAFVEFDMTESGYGGLFLPSLATVKGVNADAIPTGGVGGECRGFPPAAGLSYCCWFQINRFSSACDSHPVRLLSVVRHMSRSEQQYVCLSVSFSAHDGCLVVSTEEEPFTFLDMMEPDVTTPTSLPVSVRLRCPGALTPGQWHHLAVVLAKDLKKSCKLNAYLNGKPVGTAKMRYIQPFPGSLVSMDPTAVVDVCALIGTPSVWKEHAALVWRVGPAYLFEEVLSPDAVGSVYAQGTGYLGNYLALENTGPEAEAVTPPLRLVTEERISFGINPAVTTVTTVAQIRDDFNEVDGRLIAKEIGIASRDQSTPVLLVQNISQHLNGTARTIGAALVGRFGTRTFSPSSASDGFLYTGGPQVILSLIAMAPDDGSLYTAVKVLVSVLETNAVMQQEMSRISGYQLLTFLLKMKGSMVSGRTLQLVLYLCRYVEQGPGSDYLYSAAAFRSLLCNLEMWHNSANNLDLSVLSHLDDILKASSGDRAVAMRGEGLLQKLLFLLCDPAVTVGKVKLVTGIITRLLREHFATGDISRLGLFLVYSLPPPRSSESCDWSSDSGVPGKDIACPFLIRNQLLLSLCELISDSSLNVEQQESLFLTLGHDWFLLFLQPHLHPSTVQLGLVLLSHLLAHPSQLDGFREGVLAGPLTESPEEPLALMDNLRAQSSSYECVSATCPGFDVLQSLLVGHAHLPQVYGALAALLLGKKARHAPEGQQTLDDILQAVMDDPAGASGQQLCPEAAEILLELVKVIMTLPIHSLGDQSPGPVAPWELQFPGSVMQFLCLLHNRRPKDPLWSSAEFLHTLAGVVFPVDVPEHGSEPHEVPPHGGGEEEWDNGIHPTRKQVCDFIRILLMDSLLNVPASPHSTHPMLLLLEFSPAGASLDQRQSFQTELQEFLMEIIYMVSSEEENPTHLHPQDTSMAVLMENVVVFGRTLVQQLYGGMFLGEPENLLDFLADQIVVALEKGQSHREKTVSALYSCTNKVLLYFLSHPQRSQSEQEVVIKTLQALTSRWDVLMATYNGNVSFITCVLYCLQLIHSGSYPEGFGCEVQTRHKRRRRLFSQVFHFNSKRAAALRGQRADSDPAGSALLWLVQTCWCKVMTERQHFLEEAYKIEISANQTTGPEPPGVGDVSPLWEETMNKAWQIYTDAERRKLSSGQQRKPGLISTAVRSVLSRLGRGAASVQEFLSCMECHQLRGHSVFESMEANYKQLGASAWVRTGSRWLQVEEELLRERALFGPGPGVLLDRRWVQDEAEGPNRTRPRIRRRAQHRSKKLPGTSRLHSNSRLAEENQNGLESETRILLEGAPGEEEEACLDPDHLTFFPSLTDTPATPADSAGTCVATPCSHTHACADMHTILQELDPGEEVKARHCVLVVSGHRLSEGVLLFGRGSMYLCESFTLSPAGDVCCRKHHPSSVQDSFLSTLLDGDPLSGSCRRWPYADVKDARFMHYLLEGNALEILITDGHSVFLVFLNRDHVSVYKRLCLVVPSLKGLGIAEVIANARKSPAVGKKEMLKWQRGDISNFEYLMHLNTLAGRTYNDMMQYPVFPWVLADYLSETLDLSNPATFRDLSKPMGAQTEKRREMFVERYEEMENSDGDLLARCHYCTHYSSAIIVASFLVRMEPFSNTFQTLQGGLDIPERMFHSVRWEWESASRDNMGDVRELIPEFYYLPDFLSNSNHIQLGCMEDGTALGDVVLPPWAKDDPHEFIRAHREALESDYVSAHLHLWIDLIFGHRQQGSAAVESLNTFHPYFYAQRRTRSPDVPLDPVVKSTMLGYVSNFGQVPKQLFSKPHPARGASRKEPAPPAHPPPFFFSPEKLKSGGQPYKELPRGPVGQIVCLEKEVLVLDGQRLLLCPLWSCCFSWGFPDNSCAFGNYATDKTFAVCERLRDWGETLCAACPDPGTLVTAGSSTVVCVWDLGLAKDKLTHIRLRQPLYGHTDAVTCLAVSRGHGVIVSGSRDRTAILWDLAELGYVAQLAGHAAAVTALAINDLTGEIASCSGAQLYLWTMKGQLLSRVATSCRPLGDILCVGFTQTQEWDARNALVTGSADGVVRMWRTEYTRTPPPPPPPAGAEARAFPGSDLHPPQPDGAGCCPGRGGVWSRQLVLCRELNRNQTATRRRNKPNPAITALAMSRSHATLLVGDAWGRVFTWICS
ncbi:WD repeat- and FYVE domain-containing protein 4 isoform X1 [Gadus morhua]|uniref:WD repeat- and FYVE domain-containing protein 4 isoform X1 n=1 Tax=Gadus morhua TaxID=8049 RepID=UPI0011B43438|nr:WD repeat- and FYVE domain-containing protein 4 isoform X1 [Gadus morhua]